MGRRDGVSANSKRTPHIRGNLPANQELRKALRGNRPKAFGIRRPLNPDSQEWLRQIIRELYDDEDIPHKVELRGGLHVTLLSARAIGKQMMRGLVAGYELGQKSRQIKQIAEEETYDSPLGVRISRVDVFQGYSLYLGVESEELPSEITQIHEVLGGQGIRGFNKPNGRGLHVTLGAAKQSNRMSMTEQRHVKHSIEDRIGLTDGSEPSLLLDGWKVYP